MRPILVVKYPDTLSEKDATILADKIEYKLNGEYHVMIIVDEINYTDITFEIVR